MPILHPEATNKKGVVFDFNVFRFFLCVASSALFLVPLLPHIERIFAALNLVTALEARRNLSTWLAAPLLYKVLQKAM